MEFFNPVNSRFFAFFWKKNNAHRRSRTQCILLFLHNFEKLTNLLVSNKYKTKPVEQYSTILWITVFKNLFGGFNNIQFSQKVTFVLCENTLSHKEIKKVNQLLCVFFNTERRNKSKQSIETNSLKSSRWSNQYKTLWISVHVEHFPV